MKWIVLSKAGLAVKCLVSQNPLYATRTATPAVQYSAIYFSTLQCSDMERNVVQCSVVQCIAVYYSTVQWEQIPTSKLVYNCRAVHIVKYITGHSICTLLPSQLHKSHHELGPFPIFLFLIPFFSSSLTTLLHLYTLALPPPHEIFRLGTD